MDDWKKEHINKNIVQLSICTICNTELLLILYAANLLSHSEVESLQLPHLTSLLRSKKLYEILISRTGSFEILNKALVETGQIEAVAILTEESRSIRSVGLISYNQNQLLGSGYSGTIVLKGSFNSNEVAVKVIPITSNEISRTLGLQEVEILKTLQIHENIIRYIFAEVSVNCIYIALELCGESLATKGEATWLKMDPVNILKMCTNGLEHIHNQNIIHIGLTPFNILIGFNNQVKICGFTSSVKIPLGSVFVETVFTQSNSFGMAPEVQVYFEDLIYRKEGIKINISRSLDIFSLGCIFFFVLTKGKHPFGDIPAVYSNICSGNSDLETSKIGNPWRTLVKKMISAEPSARPTCSEIMTSGCFNTDSIRTYGAISFDKKNVLGTGCLGTTVFKGWFEVNDVAVKVLTSYFIKPEKALREVEILANLEPHENILRYYAAECNEDFTYIALEICQHNLQAEIKSSRLNMNPLGILEQCTNGLAHLHKHSIIHRDLKPLNILLKEGGQVKICDFGLSKQIPMGKETVTVPSGAGGTLDWMAPEILKHIFEREEGDPIEPIRMKTSADIFSLGCIFYYVLMNGAHPFGKGSLRQHNIYSYKPQLSHYSFVGFDKWLDLVQKMIHQEPIERPTADEILNIVSELAVI